jgi:hypothetical protein
MATFDVTAAFLEGTADRRLFARLPSCTSATNQRVEIIGNWYGLKQGPKIWNDQLNAILLTLGFVRCPVHPCLYTRTRKGVFILLGVHVDDGLMGCSHDAELNIFLAEFKEHVTDATITRKVLKYTGTTMEVNHEEHYVCTSPRSFKTSFHADLSACLWILLPIFAEPSLTLLFCRTRVLFVLSRIVRVLIFSSLWESWLPGAIIHPLTCIWPRRSASRSIWSATLIYTINWVVWAS